MLVLPLYAFGWSAFLLQLCVYMLLLWSTWCLLSSYMLLLWSTWCLLSSCIVAEGDDEDNNINLQALSSWQCKTWHFKRVEKDYRAISNMTKPYVHNYNDIHGHPILMKANFNFIIWKLKKIIRFKIHNFILKCHVRYDKSRIYWLWHFLNNNMLVNYCNYLTPYLAKKMKTRSVTWSTRCNWRNAHNKQYKTTQIKAPICGKWQNCNATLSPIVGCHLVPPLHFTFWSLQWRIPKFVIQK